MGVLEVQRVWYRFLDGDVARALHSGVQGLVPMPRPRELRPPSSRARSGLRSTGQKQSGITETSIYFFDCPGLRSPTVLDPATSCLPFPLGVADALESAALVSIRFPVYDRIADETEAESTGLNGMTHLAFDAFLACLGIRLSTFVRFVRVRDVVSLV